MVIDNGDELDDLLEAGVTSEANFEPDTRILAKPKDFVKHLKGLTTVGDSNYVGTFWPQVQDASPICLHLLSSEPDIHVRVRETRPTIWGRQLGEWVEWIFCKN